MMVLKKIIFTLILAIYSLSTICQVIREDVGSVELPENTSKITKERLREHIVTKFENDQVFLKNAPLRKPEHEYIIKDVLIDINFANYPSGQRVDIIQKKKDSDGLFGISKSYRSEIRDINGNKAFITNRIVSGNIESYQFFLYNKEGTKVITGMLDFHRDNKAAATAILEHILQHAKFKD